MVDEFKRAFHLLFKEMMVNPVIFDSDLMKDDKEQWERLMDIARMSEINYNFTKDYEN